MSGLSGLAEGGEGRAGGGAEAREGFGGGEADVEVFVGQGGGEGVDGRGYVGAIAAQQKTPPFRAGWTSGRHFKLVSEP